MVFKTHSKLSIECSINFISNKTVIGNLWLWADGVRLGDAVGSVDIFLIIDRLLSPLRNNINHDLDRLNADQIYRDLSKKFYFEIDNDEQYSAAMISSRQNLVISAPDLEGFDSVFLALIGCANGNDRFIWKQKGDDKANEITLSNGEYQGVLMSCVSWLELQTGQQGPRI